MTDEHIASVIAAYRRDWTVVLLQVDVQGRRSGRRAESRDAVRALAIAEALRWGEPSIVSGEDDHWCWAVPLMINAHCTGGLVAEVPAARLAGRARPGRIDGRQACAALRALAIEHNLTNAALLDRQRQDASLEAHRAEAIHVAKRLDRTSIHDAWIREEPALIAAIRRGDDREARRLLNRVLVVVYGVAGSDQRLLKSFVMELVVTMARSAVEAGAPPDRAAVGLSHLAELVAIDDDERLHRWVARCLNDLLAAIATGRQDDDGPQLAQAMRIITERCREPLGRDQVARLCRMSPAHFSRRFSARFGMPFVVALNRARCDRAARLLKSTERTLAAISGDCGFADQSYFTKVFRRHMGRTPSAWRSRPAG